VCFWYWLCALVCVLIADFLITAWWCARATGWSCGTPRCTRAAAPRPCTSWACPRKCPSTRPRPTTTTGKPLLSRAEGPRRAPRRVPSFGPRDPSFLCKCVQKSSQSVCERAKECVSECKREKENLRRMHTHQRTMPYRVLHDFCNWILS
jgi:hypothetical protein